MSKMEQLKVWLSEIETAVRNQPDTSWTVARMQLAYPSPNSAQRLVQIDAVAAEGECNAHVEESFINESSGRIQIEARFDKFELKGKSNVMGPFRILLQDGAQAKGTFVQRHADSLFPLHGGWLVPFVLETARGRLIPRPSDPPVLLRTAEPGEFEIPPIGTWFEKMDPISMVPEKEPDGPTILVVQHAMHIMLRKGKGKGPAGLFYES